MPTEIDDLRIKINAQADTANAAIDNLVDKLDSLTSRLGKIDGGKLTGLANGVSAFGNAVKLVGSVDKRNFDKLAANITKIASIDTASINRAASSMNQLRNGLNSLSSVSQNAVQISEIAANISKLGGKNVTNAITNLPLLTTELNKFMSVMANSPQVSKNIIDMTNALANLAGQGRSVGAATSTLTNGLNKGNKSIARTSKSTTSLASAFGRFYATYFLVIRSIKGLWGSIEKTADYFEALNYFNVAFNKIANEWKGDWEKYGKELGVTTAEAYAESFTSRMEDTFSKLSGIEFNAEKGLLSETGIKNLGLNIQQLTQYASQLASVTNSLKFTGEASLATSQAFVKLAGDVSSLHNVDYEQVSANFTSALLGQSKAVYKYGYDITQATLQTKAYELGLSKAVSEMTQGEKAQLRLLSILEQSKVAWGDQANTVNSLSNQMRLLKNGWSETSMVFGQLFVPLLENALPIVNGMVIALKRLLINVAGFMGVKIDPNKFNTGLNNNEEVLDGIASGFEDATAAAKEYENQILGFDEITKLQDTTATVGVSADGSGIDLTAQILDATSEYEKVWNEAYNNMENRANEWADVMQDKFAFLEPIAINMATAFKNLYTAVSDTSNISGSFLQGVLEGVSDSTVTLVDGLAKGIEKTGEALGLFDEETIKGFGEFVGKVLVLAPIVNIISKLVNGISKLVASVKKIATPLLAAAKSIGSFSSQFSNMFAGADPNILVAPLFLVYEGLSVLAELVLPQSVIDFFTNLNDKLVDLGNVSIKNIMSGIKDALYGIFNFSDTIKIFEYAKEFFENAQEAFDKQDWFALGENVVSGILMGLAGAINFIFEPIYDFFDGFFNAVCDVFGINGPAKEMYVIGEYIVQGVLEGIVAIPSQIATKFTTLKNAMLDKATLIFKKENWTFAGIKDGIVDSWTKVTSWWGTNAVSNWFNNNVVTWFSKSKWNFTGIKDGLSSAFENAISAIKEIWNTFAGWINDALNLEFDGFSKSFNVLGKKVEIGLPAFEVSLGSLPTFATGGFPEDGLFMANHNELVGQFSNGRTAVANNEQITAGIANAVGPAVYEAVLSAMQSTSNGNGDITINIDGKRVFRVMREQAHNYTMQTGKPAF